MTWYSYKCGGWQIAVDAINQRDGRRLFHKGDRMNELPEISNYAIVEIMGHKVVAGLVSKSEMFGGAMLRVDVPATSEYPAFTQFYGTASIYAITFVSEEVAKRTAEHAAVNPVSVYVPDLVTREHYDETVRELKERIRELRDSKPALQAGDEAYEKHHDDPDPADWDDDDDDESDPGF
jgi:hypothetical protein